MAYNMQDNTYDCDFCGVTMKWDETDDHHGTMWQCNYCGKTFCSLCFKTALGSENYETMLQDYNEVICHECFPKYNP